VPYALKAADAETLGGLPLSAFVLAAPNGVASVAQTNNATDTGATGSVVPPAASNVTTNGGTANTIPMFTTTKNIQNSILTQTGTTAVNVAGKLNFPAIAAATSTGGRNSRPADFVASAFNSTSSVPVAQTFQLQAEPTGNNTAAPTGTLSLLYGSGTAAPKETGLKISNKGILAFAAGQTFPGTGKGTITGVTAGTDLLGGGTSGVVTLNLDTTKIPVLGGSNNFTAPEQFKANVGVGAAASTAGYTPLSVSGATNFGTWLALANTSTGGHTWNIISAGAGNAEGAGNFGITDLRGTSTIWLEANTNVSGALGVGTGTPGYKLDVSSGDAVVRGVGNFKSNGETANLFVGDSNHVIAATFGGGLGLGTYQAPNAIYIHDGDGNTTIGYNDNYVSNWKLFVSADDGGAIYGQGVAPSTAGIHGQGGNGSNGDQGGPGVAGYGGSGASGGLDGPGGYFEGGHSANGGDGIYAESGSAFAGFFDGDVDVNGTLFKNGGAFKIDHPLSPANKYLYHSFVESPDMMNIYNGNVVTDASGEAIVTLPDWFEALNRDFRYQLTALGQPAQVWVAAKIAGGKFTIKTDKPNVEISWQVTGVRQDPWANAHRIPVEEEKTGRERGLYLHPELYGASAQQSIAQARRPKTIQPLREPGPKKAAHAANLAAAGSAR
jgi:hypothetical protein